MGRYAGPGVSRVGLPDSGDPSLAEADAHASILSLTEARTSSHAAHTPGLPGSW